MAENNSPKSLDEIKGSDECMIIRSCLRTNFVCVCVSVCKQERERLYFTIADFYIRTYTLNSHAT